MLMMISLFELFACLSKLKPTINSKYSTKKKKEIDGDVVASRNKKGFDMTEFFFLIGKRIHNEVNQWNS